jgi:hypothetical protein
LRQRCEAWFSHYNPVDGERRYSADGEWLWACSPE